MHLVTDPLVAAAALAQGHLAVLPTETVYGLGARADDPAALARVYATKGRPADHPLIVHIADLDALHAWSADVPTGTVQPLHYFGNDLVVFRGMNGQVSVLDAHCQHLGASLAHGGCVVKDGIQCPFHGWVWNGEGRNVRIPYESRPNRVRRVRPWRVTELNDCIFIWHDAQ